MPTTRASVTDRGTAPSHDLADQHPAGRRRPRLGTVPHRRLGRTAAVCRLAYGRLVNGARLRTVAREIGGDPTSVQRFAALVAGGDGPRWPILATPPIFYESRGKAQVRDMSAPGALTVRLRALFGVAVRADILAVLATSSASAPSLAELAMVTRSSKRNVALAVDRLRLGGAVDVDRVGNQQRVRLSTDPGFRSWLNEATEGVDWATRCTVSEAVLRFATTSPAPGIARAVEARVLSARRSRLRVVVAGRTVEVQGRVMDGIFRISDFWIPRHDETRSR